MSGVRSKVKSFEEVIEADRAYRHKRYMQACERIFDD